MTSLTWWLRGTAIAWFAELIWGAILLKVFSGWSQSTFVERLRGDGRLAWQSSTVGARPILWHNGMVGGSASYLGIVQEVGIGVIVLTNTAILVDTIGVKILSEMVKLKLSDLAEQVSD